MPAIVCQHIHKSYHHTCSLHDVSLTLEQGSVTGLLGPNGAGKSTLIKCLLGFVKPDRGTIITPAGTTIGYLPELARIPPSLSAWKMVQLACQLTHTDSTDQISSLLNTVLLAPRHWHKPLGTFSKGMRQRVALAYAIAGQPNWLILDEPMSGLDAMGRRQFLDILLDLNARGTGMLVCSHIVPDLVRLCNRVLLIHQGSMIDTIHISAHSMEEAAMLENRLIQTAGHDFE
ncbi:ABC transporter ATP-binding protein [Mariprofundus erugo]|uniref:ABC transporter ATP-binding protein n=1 Tax=Mariprofundus erugo TaxID=2528639 RepID=A0A5R9GNZ7_9PROT|nr:ABC transporter ATP-binding protein [Mariprofundus erugo]TLS67348.1 ABC transporter ATP-binding protein [Mariprofundus erugo]